MNQCSTKHSLRFKLFQLLLIFFLAIPLVLPNAPTATAAPLTLVPRDAPWGVIDGPINTAFYRGNTLYLGGNFSYLGPETGHFVSLNPITGVYDPTLPKFDETIIASCPDGAGGLFIVTFDASTNERRLVRLRADKTLDPNWNITFSSIGFISVTVAGGVLYVGGSFTQVEGQPRTSLAAFDIATGALLPWAPDLQGVLYIGFATTGTTLYVSGKFTAIDGQSRTGLAAFDTTTGALLPWSPQLGYENSGIPIENQLVIANGVAYMYGAFTSVNGQARDGLAAIDASTGTVLPWSPTVEGDSYNVAIAAGEGYLFIGGYSLTGINGQPRSSLASFDLATGNLTDWTPAIEGRIFPNAMVVNNGRLYLGGDIFSAEGQARGNLAAYDVASGALTDWNPMVGGYSRVATVATISISSGKIYAGGSFISANGLRRNGLAAIDATTGLLTQWNPNVRNGLSTSVPGTVSTMMPYGDQLYIGGTFGSVGDQPRNAIAAVGLTDGTLRPWAPEIDGYINTLAVNENHLFIGGEFVSVDGEPRSRVASFNLPDGTLNLWRPNPEGEIQTILLTRSKIYIGGKFARVASVDRRNIASFDLATGVLLDWNPNPDDGVAALSLSGDQRTLYIGGWFKSIGGQLRNGLAAVDLQTNTITDWTIDPIRSQSADGSQPTETQPPFTPSIPSPGPLLPRISYIFAFGSSVYVSGNNIDCPDRCYFAVFDATTGARSTWDEAQNIGLGPIATNGTSFLAANTLFDIVGLIHKVYLPDIQS